MDRCDFPDYAARRARLEPHDVEYGDRAIDAMPVENLRTYARNEHARLLASERKRRDLEAAVLAADKAVVSANSRAAFWEGEAAVSEARAVRLLAQLEVMDVWARRTSAFVVWLSECRLGCRLALRRWF